MPDVDSQVLRRTIGFFKLNMKDSSASSKNGGQADSGTGPNPAVGGNPAGGWVWVALGLLAVAIAGAGYLTVVALSHGAVAGCGPGSGCDKVLQSRWAYWLNLPVSLPALLVYGALFIAVRQAGKRSVSPDEERGAWTAIIPLAFVVAGAALWFIGLQALVIHAFCKFCLAAHTCGLVAATVCLYHTPVTADAPVSLWATGSGQRGLHFKSVFLLALLGLLGLGLLSGGQLLVQKERNVVTEFPRGTTNPVSTARSAAGTNATALAATPAGLPAGPNLKRLGPRTISLYDGKYRLDLADYPMIGSPDATNILVHLFDYNCHHCRGLHPMLVEAQQVLSNQLGIVCLPLAMATNCNPYMGLKQWPSVSNSCESARLVLAVHHADPAKYRQFDDWVFGLKDPPSLAQAQAFAAGLVGSNQLATALANPLLDQQILTGCMIHWSDYEGTGRAIMPHLILGPVISAGPLNSTTHLLVLLEKYLGIKMPQ